MIEKIKKNLKYLKVEDVVSPFILILAIPFAFILKLVQKLQNKPLWLICENGETAADNGFCLFEYIRKNKPKDNVYYVIDKTKKDYENVKQLGNIISYKSFRHWIYYLAAQKNISNHKSGNPNAPLFYFLQVSGILKNKRIFLQHGITMNNVEYLHYNNAKFNLITCGAKPEYEYIKENFGYSEDAIVYTGFARFDRLHQAQINPKQIVLMPTWRSWIARETNFLDEKKQQKQSFTETAYYQEYHNLLHNRKLIEYLEQHDITLYFYPHILMQKFIGYFQSESSHIVIVSNQEKCILELLSDSALMVTDYSSVSIDFAYMKKPVIYYQFDYEDFRKKHLSDGYFSYEKDGFGPIIKKEEELVDYMIQYCENNYQVEDKYLKRHQTFFTIYDDKNCERIYQCIEKR